MHSTSPGTEVMNATIACHWHPFEEELTANPDIAPWCNIPPAYFHDAVTGGTPKQVTGLRVAWHTSEWRILFDCDDTNAWATMYNPKEPLYEEETVEVFFDPHGDLQGYFEIEVNPLNAVLEIVFRKSRSGYKGDRNWKCKGLRTKVRRTKNGWAAELSIPFSAVVNRAPEALTRWRANFCRIDRPDGKRGTARELTAWSPPGRANFHTPEKFGIVEFLL